MKFYFFLLYVVQIVAKIVNKNGFCSENVNFYLFIWCPLNLSNCMQVVGAQSVSACFLSTKTYL